MKDYHINVFYSEEDEGYIADIPDLKHCSAFGTTPEEALQELLKAKKAWLEAAKVNKKPIPTPHYRPHEESEIESPEWHRDILEERKRKIKNGKAEFISLEELK